MSDPTIYPPNFVPDEEWLRKKEAQKKFEEEQASPPPPKKEPKPVGPPVANPKPDPTSDAAKWERGVELEPEPEPRKSGKPKK